MPVEVVMPKLGLTMTEGLIVEWKKKEGDEVKKGDVLFVLETEKVTYEVEAPEDGVLGKIVINEQETVPVGTIVGYLLKSGESAAAITATPTAAEVTKTQVASIGDADKKSSTAAYATVVPQSCSRVKSTPLAKKIAREYGIELSKIKGSGPGGRILRGDVEKARQEASVEDLEASAAKTEKMPERQAEEKKPEQEGRLVKFTSMRRAIAKNMLTSKVEAALAYMDNYCDATKVKELREEILPYVEKKTGVRITITDVLMKITGAAIREHPIINTRWTEQGILYLPDVHMGMAMALDEGLIVPVIRNINSKSIAQVAIERTDFIIKGKAGKFMPDDISGGTFTFSAMGMFGIEHFTAIVNQPENAILAAGSIIDKPIAMNGEVVIKPMINVSLTYDHRTIDGAEAGKFMRTLKMFIENPLFII
jgi:pyruvate dehydrogenase E2 component (dihydrolipoamide acetyltransferase)